MNWQDILYILFAVFFGYLPYKVLQKKSPRGLKDITLKTSLFLMVWFLLFSLLLLLQIYKPTIDLSLGPLGIFLFTTLVWIFVPLIVPRYRNYPKKFLDSGKKLYIGELNPKTYYLKYFEVVFQQVKFIYLLEVVLGGLSIWEKLLSFTIIIVIIHLGNLFFLPIKETLFFTLLSLPMAAVFGILITQGYLLFTASLHLWFYLLYSVAPWLGKDKS